MQLYHGTPAYFERFDASLRGNGEGASLLIKVGTYLSESLPVADAYRQRLADPHYHGTAKSYWMGLSRFASVDDLDSHEENRPIEQLGSVLEVGGVDESALIDWEGGVEDQPFDMADILKGLYSEEELAAIDEFIECSEEAEDISIQFDLEETVEKVMLYGPGETADLMQDTSKEDVDWSVLASIVGRRGLSLPLDDDHHAGQAFYALVVGHCGGEQEAAEWLSERGIHGVVSHLELPLGDAIPESAKNARTIIYWNDQDLVVKRAVSPDEIEKAHIQAPRQELEACRSYGAPSW
jgi:hypothetical protein